MQAPEYRDNKIHTGWLDSRIAMRVRSERPPWEISVVGGALYVSCFQGLHLVVDVI